MSGIVYVNKDTGLIHCISDKEIVDSNLEIATSFPPSINHKWNSATSTWELKTELEIVQENPKNTAILDSALSFEDLSSLNVTNDFSNWDTADILYYRNIKPLSKNNGIQTKSKGYLAFPKLSFDSTKEKKTISFILYCSNDSTYYLLGLASKERFNWNSNSFANVEIGCQFRNYRGCLYQHGLSKNNQSLLAFLGYESFEVDGYFRFDFENNGDRREYLKLYELASGDKATWLGGTQVAEIALMMTPDRSGKTKVPIITKYLGSKNYLLGVIVH